MVGVAVILCTALAAGLVQTVTGFGAGVVLIMVLSRMFEMTVAPTINTSICLVLSLSLVWRFRRDIQPKLVLVPIIPYLIMSVCAISLLRFMDMKVLAIAFGLFLMALSVFFFFFEKRVHIRGNYPTAIFCGTISGVFAGLFGVGGPLMALYFLTITKTRAAYVATIQFFFVVTNIVSLVTRGIQGYYSLDLLPYTLIGIVGVNLGKLLGLRVAEKLDGQRLKQVIYLFVGLSGAINVIQQLV